MQRPAEVECWEEVSGRLNRVLLGWPSCFSNGTRLLAYRALDKQVNEEVRGLLRSRRKVSPRRSRQLSEQVVVGKLTPIRHEIVI